MSSNSTAEVVEIQLKPHPDPETTSLSIVEVYGFTVVVRTESWLGVDKGVYITPDTIVDVTRPEFQFLASDNVGRTKERIKVKKLRGVISMGLLIPAPENANLGDDLWNELGLERYEPVAESKDSDCVKAPTAFVPKYDIDNFYRYKDNFIPEEPFLIMEKINGENQRFVYLGQTQYVGSRNLWKKDTPESKWWIAYREIPGIKEFCEANPGFVLWGESYGKVGKFHYGKQNWTFAAFDIMRPDCTFLDADELILTCESYNIPMAPIIHKGPYDIDKLPELAEGKSTMADHVREGVVIRPVKERKDRKGNRVILKIVGNGYLMKE